MIQLSAFVNDFSEDPFVEHSLDASSIDEVGIFECCAPFARHRFIETKLVKIIFADGVKTKIFVLMVS